MPLWMLIARKEIILHLRESRFPWITGLFCGMVLVGLTVSAADISMREVSHSANQTAERHRLQQMDLSGTTLQQVRRLTETQGVYAFRPPAAMAALASGLDDLIPKGIHVSQNRSWARQTSEAFYRNPMLDLFPRPDYAAVVVTVFSLVGLFFAYDAFTGEKANGTLKLVFSTAASRAQVLAGKWAGACVTLAIPFLLATVAGALVLGLMQPGWSENGGYARLLASMALSLIYLSLFVTAGLAISALSRTPMASLLMTLAVWVFSAFVAPHLLSAGGGLLEPVPTFQEIKRQKRAIDSSTWAEHVRLNAELENKAISKDERDRRVEALWEQAGVSRSQIDQAYGRELSAQTDLSRRLSSLSPSAGYLMAAAEIANTGINNYQQAFGEFHRYREAFSAYATDLRARAESDELSAEWFRVENIPALKTQVRSLAEGLSAISFEVALLLAIHLLLAVIAWVGFLRFDVR